jgi:hypothetical protein
MLFSRPLLLTIGGSSSLLVYVQECLPPLALFRSFSLNPPTNPLLTPVTRNADSHGKRIGRQNPHRPPVATTSRKAKSLPSMGINRHAKEYVSVISKGDVTGDWKLNRRQTPFFPQDIFVPIDVSRLPQRNAFLDYGLAGVAKMHVKSYQNGFLASPSHALGFQMTCRPPTLASVSRPREGLQVFPCSHATWIYRYLENVTQL